MLVVVSVLLAVCRQLAWEAARRVSRVYGCVYSVAAGAASLPRPPTTIVNVLWQSFQRPYGCVELVSVLVGYSDPYNLQRTGCCVEVVQSRYTHHQRCQLLPACLSVGKSVTSVHQRHYDSHVGIE